MPYDPKNASSKMPRKDLWDKANVILTVISAFAVAAISGATSYLVARRQAEIQQVITDRQNEQALAQLRQQNEQFKADNEQKRSELLVARAQVIEKFLPYLSKDNVTRRAAVEVIGMIDPELSARLGSLYFEVGGHEALRELVRSGDKTVARPAGEALIRQTENPASSITSVTNEQRHRIVLLRDGGNVTLRIKLGAAALAKYRGTLFDADGGAGVPLFQGLNTDRTSDTFSIGKPNDLIGKSLGINVVATLIEKFVAVRFDIEVDQGATHSTDVHQLAMVPSTESVQSFFIVLEFVGG